MKNIDKSLPVSTTCILRSTGEFYSETIAIIIISISSMNSILGIPILSLEGCITQTERVVHD